jgi:UDP-N-acetyl-D-mannosaminuronate dehydrogenase
MVEKVLAALGEPVGKRVGALGLAFKPNTDDIREAPSLSIIPALQEAGIAVQAHDPAAMPRARELLDSVEFCEGPYEAAADTDAVIILTEWNAYRALDLERLKAAMAGRVIVDLRNIYAPQDMARPRHRPDRRSHVRPGRGLAAGPRLRGIGRPVPAGEGRGGAAGDRLHVDVGIPGDFAFDA